MEWLERSRNLALAFQIGPISFLILFFLVIPLLIIIFIAFA